MSKPRFTEGPWSIAWANDEGVDPYFDVMKQDGDADDEGRMVDASYSIIEMAYPVTDEETARANAALIAASPSLYYTLDRALIWLRFLAENHHPISSHPQAIEVRNLIRSAEHVLAYARDEHVSVDDEE